MLGTILAQLGDVISFVLGTVGSLVSGLL